jgi:prepilin-type N-terminal cleavage/methylation domain-containing protein
MLSKTHKPKNGFTIIEIMIVLAIAGLIMLIVFLAVPALQRSARNTQRKNDAAAISAAIANYVDNNAGSTPGGIKAAAGSNTNLLICSSNVCAGNTETAALGFYSTTNAGAGGVISLVNGVNPVSPLPSTSQVIIDVGENCNGTALGTASGRSVAILYAIETNSSATGYAEQCTGS